MQHDMAVNRNRDAHDVV